VHLKNITGSRDRRREIMSNSVKAGIFDDPYKKCARVFCPSFMRVAPRLCVKEPGHAGKHMSVDLIHWEEAQCVPLKEPK
jgi:hypothetical protein